MAQSTKFIDVTRSYVPIDPNSFPESLHGASREDSPEQKIPVMAYKGYNFLPTSYGYKSYFGTGKTIGIDALTARVDHIFIFQNQGYENILIALTDTGVWTKKGDVAGAWVNNVPMLRDIAPSIHYEWTHVIIANTLYAYRQGQPSYQKFVHNSTTQLTITSVVPSFLNMAAQVGIFRAAGRLAFWDSADSIGWSNLDDFADFSPSLETLAGNSKFADIQGRIVTIKPHGPGFIIYATKSVIYIAQSIESLYQWKPVIILSAAGISYPRQAVVASPDTIHYAYTSDGLKKIELAREETIVPEATDFLKDYAFPVYLRVLEGRYLFLELLDVNYVTGLVQIADVAVPAVSYVFPGSSADINTTTPDDGRNTFCSLSEGISRGVFNTPPAPADRNLSTLMRPAYTCYFSNSGTKFNDNIVWTATPCLTIDPNGVDALMNPGGQTTAGLTQTSANKTASTSSSAWNDLSGWTMGRFVATQTAIWEMEEKNLKAFKSAATNRAKSASKNTPVNSCIEVPFLKDECIIGRYPGGFSAPQFGYSACKFWLTRYADSAYDLVRVKTNSVVCKPKETFSPWDVQSFVTLTGFSSPQEGIAALQTYSTTIIYSLGAPGAPAGSAYTAAGTVRSYEIMSSSPNGVVLQVGWTHCALLFSTEKTETMNAHNKAEDVADFGVGAIDTAYCELSGWNYTTTSGTAGFVAAAGCTAPTSYPRTGSPPTKAPISDVDGSLCGIPYVPKTIGTYVANWPTETVTIPAGSFLLQKGSNAPLYPTFEGALVYDLQLKKWGKMKLRYKQLLDYSPINSTLNGVVPSNVFGIMSGAFGSNGKISLFDASPADSYISYGKIGYFRGGNTSPEEVHVHFRTPSTGSLTVETSLEGRNLAAGFTKTENFNNATEASLCGAYPGRWCNIEIRGIYDINYLEYRGFIQGRR